MLEEARDELVVLDLAYVLLLERPLPRPEPRHRAGLGASSAAAVGVRAERHLAVGDDDRSTFQGR